MSGEVWYDATCLDCGASYTEDAINANLATCRECGSENVEWAGFTL